MRSQARRDWLGLVCISRNVVKGVDSWYILEREPTGLAKCWLWGR